MAVLTEEEVKMRMVVDKLTLDLFTPEIRKKANDANLESNWFLHCFKLFVRELINIEAELKAEENITAKESKEVFKSIIEAIIDYKGIEGFFNIITPLDFGRKPDNYDEMKKQIKNALREGLN